MKEVTKRVCGAKTRSGGKCQRPQMANGRCRLHGGATPAPGPSHPNFKTGRYSKVLKGSSMSEAYQRALHDPNLLALREEIALLVAKQQETVERMVAERGIDYVQSAMEQLGVLRMALRDSPATAAVRNAAEVLTRTMEEWRGDADVWVEYTERTEQIRKLVDTERKYQEGLKNYVPADQLQAVVAVWLDCMRQTIPQEYLLAFHERLRKVRSAEALMSGRDVTRFTGEA